MLLEGRSVSLRGLDPNPKQWPVLSLNVTQKLGLGAVRHLVVTWWSSRSELFLVTPSFAPMAPSSAPTATAGGPPLLLFNNCALAVRSGLAPAGTLAYFESLPRPPSLPGVQQVVTSVNQTGCLNATVYNATANTTTPRVPAPAAMELCRQGPKGCPGVAALVLVSAATTALVIRSRHRRQHRPSDYAAAGANGGNTGSEGGASGLVSVCVVTAGSSQPQLSDSCSGTPRSGSIDRAPLSTATISKCSAGAGADSGVATLASATAMQSPPPLAVTAVTTTADSATLEQHLSRHLHQQEALVTSATPFRENLNIRASVEMSSHPDSFPAQSQTQTSANTYLSTVNSNAFGDFRLRQAHAHANSHPAQLPSGQGSTAVTSGATAALAALAVRPTSCMGAVGQGAQQDSAGGGGGAVDSGSEGDSVVQLLPIVLGKGGFGRVVAGTYRGQPVAVKQLLDDAWWAAGAGPRPAGASIVDAGQRDELVRAFVQEVEILGRCDHPNVARLHAVCLTPPHLSLVLERCETSLDKLIYGGAGNAAAAGGRGSPGVSEDKSEPLGARSPPPLLPLSKVLHIAIQVAKGLEYLHPTIVHRDLKPANVLLNDADGPNPVAKLSDFGLSRMRNATQSTMQPQAGTAAYLAPECFSVEDSTPVGCRADIYSFGVLLWTMLSGKQPWADFSLVAIAFKVGLQQQRLPLEHLQAAGRCTPKLDKLIRQCWETDPLRRPAAGEVWKALVLCEQELRGAA
ncbi:hypothetical protein HXX76_004076 [Chlamydomonas incerta]|uniref:Protein kinase domain-containing protein n=1 Tax=Chlamydomonas incerta TaxID=51695 RepID=A0A835T6R8_CHLIN|nr:hypothetical protein HXX76_004076 [Chlamydomonas incerta]|eukprot:KAG2439957.1 hypothetical protein HXX76_004076 [Chlamydomonas incerta]